MTKTKTENKKLKQTIGKENRRKEKRKKQKLKTKKLEQAIGKENGRQKNKRKNYIIFYILKKAFFSSFLRNDLN